MAYAEESVYILRWWCPSVICMRSAKVFGKFFFWKRQHWSCRFYLNLLFCMPIAGPKFWLNLVPLQKLLYWHKNQFYWMQIIFLCCTKCLWLPKYVNKFLTRHKKFGPAQNILGPGIRCLINREVGGPIFCLLHEKQRVLSLFSKIRCSLT